MIYFKEMKSSITIKAMNQSIFGPNDYFFQKSFQSTNAFLVLV